MPKILKLFIIAIAMILLHLPTGLVASYSPSDQISVIQQWQTYTDPKLGFSISYPSYWSVIPRNDSLGAGATLVIVDNAYKSHNSKVEIGMYLVEANPDQSLEDWTIQYELFSRSLDQPTNLELTILKTPSNETDLLQAKGSSSITEYRFTNILRGKIVWFIWSNVSDSNIDIYNKIVESFRFSDSTPYSLQDVYGERFRPFSWFGTSKVTGNPSLHTINSPNDNLFTPLNLGTW
ncbi:hypothetical protein [Bellilinea sp.]